MHGVITNIGYSAADLTAGPGVVLVLGENNYNGKLVLVYKHRYRLCDIDACVCVCVCV